MKLNEQNVALSRELEKYKGSVKTPGRKAKGKDKGKEKEKRTGKDTQETTESKVSSFEPRHEKTYFRGF